MSDMKKLTTLEKKPFALKVQTVRVLELVQLEQVGGGLPSGRQYGCPTQSVPSEEPGIC